MNVSGKVLGSLEMVYTVTSLELDGRTFFLAASEARGGSCLLFRPPDWTASTVWEKPGGAMTLAPLPGGHARLVAIQEFFPVFDSDGAGLVLARAGKDVTRPWPVRRVLDLPFAHRLEVVTVGGAVFVLAATLCGGKDFQDDWSRPGAVYLARIPDDGDEAWEATPVLSGLSINHGMQRAVLDGRDVVLVSGREGLFQIVVPESPDGAWQSQCLIDHEISDMSAADIDGDGRTEIAAIEPFHGDRLVVYKRGESGWTAVYEGEMSFGHVVWAGTILGEPALLAGNRGAGKELLLLRPAAFDPWKMEQVVLDEGTGPTQIAVVHQPGREWIVAANHAVGQVALYQIAP